MILFLFECPIWVISKPSTLIEKNEKMKKECRGLYILSVMVTQQISMFIECRGQESKFKFPERNSHTYILRLY